MPRLRETNRWRMRARRAEQQLALTSDSLVIERERNMVLQAAVAIVTGVRCDSCACERRKKAAELWDVQLAHNFPDDERDEAFCEVMATAGIAPLP